VTGPKARDTDVLTAIVVEPIRPGAKELAGHPTYYRLWLPRHHRLVYRILREEAVIDLLYARPKLPDLHDRLGLARPGDQ
jgi:hypothetical protein